MAKLVKDYADNYDKTVCKEIKQHKSNIFTLLSILEQRDILSIAIYGHILQ